MTQRLEPWFSPVKLARAVAVAGAVFALLGGPAPAAAQTTHNIDAIGDLGGGLSVANAVNTFEQVAGNSYTGDGMHSAFIWDRVQGIRALADLGGSYSEAWDVSDAGDVVGASATNTGEIHPCVWFPSGVTDLGTLGGGYGTALGTHFKFVDGVSVREVVGVSLDGSGVFRGFYWRNGAMSALPAFVAGGESVAQDVNGSGVVAGYAQNASGEYRACTWQNGTIQELTGLDSPLSVALSINDAGAVVGYYDAGNGALHGFLWQNGVVTDLPPVEGAYSVATSVNENGQVVGDAEVAGGDVAAVFWQNGQPALIETLLDPNPGWTTYASAAVNDRDKIIGTGLLGDVESGFITSPVFAEPEQQAEAQAQDIADDVTALLNSGQLAPQDGVPLEQRMEQAAEKMQQASTSAALAMLRKFISDVEKLRDASPPRIAAEDAAALIASTEQLIQDLEGSP